jgi:electron transport complex protein RnfG
VAADGRLLGVRVTQHKETPGLGDYIDPRKDKNKERPWITQFDDLSLATVAGREWRSGRTRPFRLVAGATVTPRAVIKAVHKALQYVAENRQQLFAAVPQSASPGGSHDQIANNSARSWPTVSGSRTPAWCRCSDCARCWR